MNEFGTKPKNADLATIGLRTAWVMPTGTSNPLNWSSIPS
jgi:hypothetical protein